MAGPPKGKFNKTKRGGGKRFTPTRVLRGDDMGDNTEGLWGEPREKPEDITSEEEASSGEEESSEEETQPKAAPKKTQRAESGPNGGDSEESGDGLEDVANPNRATKKNLKASDLAAGGDRELSRREREAMEKERAKAAWWKAQMEGKTDQARADLARLAIIRKQREEAAKKKAEEQATKNKASASRSESLNAGKGIISKSLGKKK
ncbi:heat- and acid-stable phosphoprotein [Borealophlyctis nickersoniae]|nr:heat- and acid-stable phosphoprotein [Borealophlyctis nickersoniae]